MNSTKLKLAYTEFRLQRPSNFFQVVEVEDAAFALAQSLGEQYGGTLGVRALDVLHVATAVRMGAVAFGTFDARQAALAEKVGLKPLR